MPDRATKPISIFIFCFSLCFTQTAGKIAGKVVDDEKNSPLVGANIIITQTQKGTSADKEGYFNLINVTPGKYSVRFMTVSYTHLTLPTICSV